ncbi:hypothetical protein, partial [Vibrio sp. V28_P6S34P95]|uniref:hypothetical protein n=3 Tax=unclassified Vibrio TaxID=2614977 RepID=UPI001F30C128
VNAIFLFFVFFIFVFRVKIGFFDLTPILFLWSIFYVILTKMKFNVVFFNFLIIYFIFICYRLSVQFINSQLNYESHFLMRDIRFLMSSVSIYVMSAWIINKNYLPSKVIIILGSVLLIHPILMYIQLFFPGVRFWFIEHLPFTDNYHAFRVNGLLNGYVPGGNFLGLISTYFFFLYSKYKMFAFLIIPFLFIPLFPISGLSGLASFIIGFSYFVVFKSGLRVKINVFVLSVVFSTVVITSYNSVVGFFPEIGKGFDRVLVLFGANDGEVNATIDGSFSTLLSSYSIPNSALNFIFGNAQASKSEFSTTSSDSGLISNIHEFGFLGLFFIFSLLAFVIFFSGNDLISILIFCCLVIFLKVDLIFSRIVFDLIVLIFSMSLLSKGHRCSFRL